MNYLLIFKEVQKKIMINLKNILYESYIDDAIKSAKKIFKKLSKDYPDVKISKLEFKNLRGRGSGYLQTSRLKGGKHIFIDKMVIDDSGLSSYDPDYSVCHEFAHAILAVKKGSLGHTRAHDKLTYELAKKFNLV